MDAIPPMDTVAVSADGSPTLRTFILISKSDIENDSPDNTRPLTDRHVPRSACPSTDKASRIVAFRIATEVLAHSDSTIDHD